jgi:hypothetical protein
MKIQSSPRCRVREGRNPVRLLKQKQFFGHLYEMIFFLSIPLVSCLRRNDNRGKPMCVYYIELRLI